MDTFLALVLEKFPKLKEFPVLERLSHRQGLFAAGGRRLVQLPALPKNLALSSPVYGRTVFARVYQTYPSGSSTYAWTLQNETPVSAANAIASMFPTYVSGLIRTDFAGPTLSSQVIADYNTIVQTVKSASHTCKFDIVIRTEQFVDASIGTFMRTIAGQLQFDGFFMDNLGNAPTIVQESASTTAHSLGKFVGGDWSTTVLPTGSFDFVADTIPSVVPLNPSYLGTALGVAPSTLAGPSNYNLVYSFNLPVLLHVNNFSPDRETFVQTFADQQRQEWLTGASQMQAGNGFALMYNVFFPEAPIGSSWDSPKDNGLLQTMQSLIGTYNPKP